MLVPVFLVAIVRERVTFLRSNTLPLLRAEKHNSGERSEGTRVVNMRSACATIPNALPASEAKNPSTWDEVYSLTG